MRLEEARHVNPQTTQLEQSCQRRPMESSRSTATAPSRHRDWLEQNACSFPMRACTHSQKESLGASVRIGAEARSQWDFTTLDAGRHLRSTRLSLNASAISTVLEPRRVCGELKMYKRTILGFV